MKKFLSNYRSTIILVASIIIGAIVGVIFQERATVLKPLGDVFLNLLLVIIVPLIFFTITTSISKMKTPKRIGKIMFTIIATFIVTSLIAVFIGFFSTYFVKLVNPQDTEKIKSSFEEQTDEESDDDDLTIADRTVQLLTVNDFSKLLSKSNIIALLVFSVITGIACQMAGDKASIAVGYLKTFVIYTVVAVVFYFVMYTLYAFFAGGKYGVKTFWKNALAPTLTSLATCSSAASIPVNIESAKKIGVPDDIAETTIPMGSSFHKDGSIIGSMFKIMFLVCLFGTTINTPGAILHVLGVALLANLLITGVPIGGGTISEMLIITMMGYPVAALPILTMIATIIDPPATMLNVVGDTVSSMMVT